MKKLISLLIIALLFSCGNDDETVPAGVDCTDIFVYGLSVKVRDASTGGVIPSGITLVAQDGAYSEELTLIFDTFVGAGERTGNYILTASGSGYETFVSTTITVELTDDECHVIPKVVTIDLQPL